MTPWLRLKQSLNRRIDGLIQEHMKQDGQRPRTCGDAVAGRSQSDGKTSYLLVSLPAAVPLIFAGNRLAPPMARTPLQLPLEQYERVRCWSLTPKAT